jgi:hypothetical protein
MLGGRTAIQGRENKIPVNSAFLAPQRCTAAAAAIGVGKVRKRSQRSVLGLWPFIVFPFLSAFV